MATIATEDFGGYRAPSSYKIGIDLDSCVFKTDEVLIDRVNKEFNMTLKMEDLTDSDLLDPFIKVEDRKRFGELIGETVMQDCLPASDHCEWILNFLHEICDFVFISSRHKTSKEATISQLGNILYHNRYNREYKLHLAGKDENGENKEKKSKYLNQEKIDIFIDDDSKHIVDAYENTECNHIFVFHKPWNGFIKQNDRIQRVFGWVGVFQRIYDMLGERVANSNNK